MMPLIRHVDRDVPGQLLARVPLRGLDRIAAGASRFAGLQRTGQFGADVDRWGVDRESPIRGLLAAEAQGDVELGADLEGDLELPLEVIDRDPDLLGQVAQVERAPVLAVVGRVIDAEDARGTLDVLDPLRLTPRLAEGRTHRAG